jgi:imidazole glycerol phosphate synthase glutamine amidotransferase subunit
VVRTGTANLASVVAALERADHAVSVTSDPDEVAGAERLVLPGVGSFGPVAKLLRDLGLAEPLAERIHQHRPTLAICLGLQLLAAASDEDPGIPGLAVLPCTATRFPDHVRVPQLGWNRISALAGCRLLSDGAGYFANSYRLEEFPDGWCGAVTDHGGQFVAAVERGPVLACQFHPELSGDWGQGLIERWLEEKPC